MSDERGAEPRIIEATLNATATGQASCEAQVRRGEVAWTYLYTVLGFALTIETGVVSLMSPYPLQWPLNLAVLLVAAIITTVAILDNGTVQNQLFRAKEHYESKFR